MPLRRTNISNQKSSKFHYSALKLRPVHDATMIACVPKKVTYKRLIKKEIKLRACVCVRQCIRVYAAQQISIFVY